MPVSEAIGEERRRRILEYLRWSITTHHGRVPTVREIAEAADLSSTADARVELRRLEQDGYIAIAPPGWRRITLVSPAPDGWGHVIRPWTLGQHSLALDDGVDYMSVRVVGTDHCVSRATFEAISGYSDAIDVMYGIVRRGLPEGTHQLPLDGAFGDAARLDGRYRELIAARG